MAADHRDAQNGRFLPGYPGGPGRPRRAIEADYLAALLDWELALAIAGLRELDP
jgi:hypothetical protein